MKSFIRMFQNSFKELKSIKCLTVTGIFIAISMVIEMFSIDIGFVKLNFAFIAIAVIGMLFGPSVSFFAGLACDLVGFIAHPSSSFLIAYTLAAGLQGLFYGMVLYHKNDRRSILIADNLKKTQKDITLFFRAVVARLLDVVVINLLINTALNLHYGFIPKEAYGTAIVARVAKNVLELVIDIPLLFILLPVALAAYKRFVNVRTAAN